MNYLYNGSQIRQIEATVIEHNILTESQMMEVAASVASQVFQQYWPNAKKIVVICGKGKNGGDGYLMARNLKQAGLIVEVFSICSLTDLQGVVLDAAQACLALEIPINEFSANTSFEGDVLIDALLGIGLQGELKKAHTECIQYMNACKLPILAVDVPSGLDINTGNVTAVACKADVTVTFIGLKQGFFTLHGPDHCGEIVCDDLDIPHTIFERVKSTAKLLNLAELSALLPTRKKASHKGNFGHVLVIGGDYGMGGAVRMAAESALRMITLE